MGFSKMDKFLFSLCVEREKKQETGDKILKIRKKKRKYLEAL